MALREALRTPVLPSAPAGGCGARNEEVA